MLDCYGGFAGWIEMKLNLQLVNLGDSRANCLLRWLSECEMQSEDMNLVALSIPPELRWAQVCIRCWKSRNIEPFFRRITLRALDQSH